MGNENTLKKCWENYNKKEVTGMENLINAFLQQELLINIPGNRQVAEQFSALGELQGYGKDEEVYQEGSTGLYLYFVLMGSCDLFVKDNFVTEIKRGQCFGEFPLLDPGLDYSVTIYSNNVKTCIAKISKINFIAVANEYPGIWKNMARMLAGRLIKSNELIYKKKPNSRPMIFIGSSSERLDVAEIIRAQLSDNFAPEIWNQGTFKVPGNHYMECLEEALQKFDFGIFVYSPDDHIISREESKETARDNVIFEHGLFTGILTRHRTFLVCPNDKNLKILSDFAGIIILSYEMDKDNLNEALEPVCRQIREAIESKYRGRHPEIQP